MAKRNRRAAKDGDTRTADDRAAEHEERVAKATAETRESIEANEKMHRAAQTKGAKADPHVQRVDEETGRLESDHRVADATVINERPEPGHQDVGQEDLQMGPLKLATPKGSPTQPSGRGRGAFTVPTATDQTGRPLVFAHPASGSDLGTQQAKASGTAQVMTGGPHGAVNPVVYSDLPAGGDLALPVFSDRLAQDPDIGIAGVVPSGAVNNPRLHEPAEVVMADRQLRPGEVVEASTGRRVMSDEPNDPGGEQLGMGPTRFHSPGGVKVQQPVKVEAPLPSTSTGEGVKVKRDSKRTRKVKRDSRKTPRAKGGAKAKMSEKAEQTAERTEETKEVKSTPTTEQKDAPLETGSSKESEE